MRFQIELTRSARLGLNCLPKTILKRVDTRILDLAEDPYLKGAKKLEGGDELWRVRVGDYRIVYRVEVERLVVLVVKVGHRRDLYR